MLGVLAFRVSLSGMIQSDQSAVCFVSFRFDSIAPDPS